MKIFVLPYVILAALLAGGCASTATRFIIGVERTGLATPGRYYLVTDHPTLATQPEYPQALACVRTALAQRGFTETTDPAATDLQITFCYGTTYSGTEVVVWPQTVVSTQRQPAPGGSPRTYSRSVEVRHVQVRVPHFNTWLIIAARTVTLGGYLDGWKVIARTDAKPGDADHVVPCLITAAQTLVAADAAVAVTLSLNPGDAAVRAIIAGRREAPPADRTKSP